MTTRYIEPVIYARLLENAKQYPNKFFYYSEADGCIRILDVATLEMDLMRPGPPDFP